MNTLCVRAHSAAGDVDQSFNPGGGVSGPVQAVAVEPDGKVLIGGPLVVGDAWFAPRADVLAFVNGTNRHGRIRLNADGRVDRGFSSAPFYPPLLAMFGGQDCPIHPFSCFQGAVGAALLALPDGRVLIGGYALTTVSFCRPERLRVVGEQLERYCGQDTTAMIRIVDALRKLAVSP